MPKFKPVKTLVHLTTEVCANLVHKTSVHLDSISWPPSHQSVQDQPGTFRSGQCSPLAPNLSPLNPHHAAVILSPITEGSSGADIQCPESSTSSQPFAENYLDFCRELQLWFRQLPVHLLELVISKVQSTLDLQRFCACHVTL